MFCKEVFLVKEIFFLWLFLLSGKIFATESVGLVTRADVSKNSDYCVHKTWIETTVNNLHVKGEELLISRAIDIFVNNTTLSIVCGIETLWQVTLPTKPANELEFEEYARKCGNTAKQLINIGQYRPKETVIIDFERFLALVGIEKAISASDIIGNLPWFLSEGQKSNNEENP